MLGTWPLRKQRHTQRFVFLRPLWKHKTPGGNTLPTTYDTMFPLRRIRALAPSGQPSAALQARKHWDVIGNGKSHNTHLAR